MEELKNIYDDAGESTTVSTAGQMMIGRQAQEVQAAMVVAKKFPRNPRDSYDRVLAACRRQTLAECSMYEYPRGGTKVTGPSIRLAEAVAQAWGNLDFGIIELEQKNAESQVMAYAWDLETNTRQTKIFTVPHVRTTKKGSTTLTDPRDIYETVANQGARRLRACILGIIPGDVIDGAVKQCEMTLKKNGAPLSERLEKMAEAFEKDYGVTKPMLEAYIGMNFAAFTHQSLLSLGSIYNSIKDGMKGPGDYFDMAVDAEFEEVQDTKPAEQQEVPEQVEVDLHALAEE